MNENPEQRIPMETLEILPAMPWWKFLLLIVTTLTLYQFNWYYRIWKFLQQQYHPDWRPVWRTIGCMIPLVCLWYVWKAFEAVKEVAEKNGIKAQYNAGGITIGWIVLQNVGSRLADYSKLDFYIGSAIEVFFISLAVALVQKVQSPINVLYALNSGQPTAPARFSRGEIVWLIAGVLMWGLIFLGSTVKS